MVILQSIQTALSGVGFAIGAGKYLGTSPEEGKIIFTGTDKPTHFLGQHTPVIDETFRIIVKGDDYISIESKIDSAATALKNAGFTQISGYTDIEAKENEDFMQIGVEFKKSENI